MADILAIRVNVERVLGFDAEGGSLKVFDLRNTEMASEIHGREEAEQFHFLDVSNQADIKLSVIEPGLRSDLHAATVAGGIGECGQDCGLSAAEDERAGLSWIRKRQLHWERREMKQSRGQCECVPAVGA